MNNKYNEVLANLTAPDQTFAFEEVEHSSGHNLSRVYKYP
jgi:hypothetical protein